MAWVLNGGYDIGLVELGFGEVELTVDEGYDCGPEKCGFGAVE
jgi:hypothetical protein